MRNAEQQLEHDKRWLARTEWLYPRSRLFRFGYHWYSVIRTRIGV